MTFPEYSEQVQPRNLQVTPQRKRTVYFINYRLVNEDGVMATPVLGNDGRVYRMPPLGERLVLPERVAAFIERRLRVYEPQAQVWIEAFTDSAEVARAVREAFARGDLQQDTVAAGRDFQQILRRQALQELSEDELEAELARRKEEAKQASTTKKTTKKT